MDAESRTNASLKNAHICADNSSVCSRLHLYPQSGSLPWLVSLTAHGRKLRVCNSKSALTWPAIGLFLPQQSQRQNIDLSRQAKFASTPAFALFVTLKNVVCKIGEDAEVLMSLYDPVESKFIR